MKSQSVRNKQKIYCEILCLKNALKPYQELMTNITNIPSVTDIPNNVCHENNFLSILHEKTRPYYEKIKSYFHTKRTNGGKPLGNLDLYLRILTFAK